MPGVDDELLSQMANRQVPRSDVARVACEALRNAQASKISFDLASKPVGEGTPTLDASTVFGALNGRTCNYDDTPIEPPSLPSLR